MLKLNLKAVAKLILFFVVVLIITINIATIETQRQKTGLKLSWILQHKSFPFNTNFKSKYVLDILSIGTVNRPNVHELYLKDSARYLKTYTEKISKGYCNQCTNKTYGTHPYRDSWFLKDHNWWCAQKRPLAALVDYFDNLNGNLRDTLPDFLLVIDDDTFVNSVLFHEFLNWLPNPERNSIYLGDTLPGSGDSFVAGGGGWLVSKKILQGLSTQKNGDFNAYICLNKQQQASGSWCWYHSDWAIGECIFKFTNAIPVHTNYFIQDSNNCVDRENLNKEIGINYDHCRKCDLMSSITCHKYNSEEQLTMHRSTMKKHRLKQT